MTANLDSSTIRHLILTTKLSGGQIGDIARNVAYAAVHQGLLSAVPDFAYQTTLGDKITAVLWELIIEGVYTPGLGMQQPNLPFLRVTEYGQKCFEAGDLTAHDADDYLRRLKTACPSIDETTLLYVGEALDTFRVGKHLAATVMIGVAAENMLFRLVDGVAAALSTPEQKTKFERETKKGRSSKAQHDEVLKTLRAPGPPIPEELAYLLTQHIDGIYDLIRRTRNEAGHPTGKRLGRDETHALLLLFPTYCKTVHDLIEWLAKNQI
jgi:hypothetical protein